MKGLTDSDLKDLMLSVGTHQPQRRLTPVQVAELIQRARVAGDTVEDCGQAIGISSTIVNKFLMLLRLSVDAREAVAWGRTGATVAFSTAADIARLDVADHAPVIRATLENRLSKDEVRQLIQLRLRSGRDIQTCIQQALDLRPTEERRYVYVGGVRSESMQRAIVQLEQDGRDVLLRRALADALPGVPYASARLSADRFTIVGDAATAAGLAKYGDDWERLVQQSLSNVIG